MSTSTTKTRNNGQWTEARYRSFVTSTLRSGSRRWPPKWATLAKAFVDKRKSKKSGRDAKHYRCAICEELFPSTQVQVDHIKPMGTTVTWDEFIEGLFCEADNLQVLCKPCHKIKTKKERVEA